MKKKTILTMVIISLLLATGVIATTFRIDLNLDEKQTEHLTEISNEKGISGEQYIINTAIKVIEEERKAKTFQNFREAMTRCSKIEECITGVESYINENYPEDTFTKNWQTNIENTGVSE